MTTKTIEKLITGEMVEIKINEKNPNSGIAFLKNRLVPFFAESQRERGYEYAGHRIQRYDRKNDKTDWYPQSPIWKKIKK